MNLNVFKRKSSFSVYESMPTPLASAFTPFSLLPPSEFTPYLSIFTFPPHPFTRTVPPFPNLPYEADLVPMSITSFTVITSQSGGIRLYCTLHIYYFSLIHSNTVTSTPCQLSPLPWVKGIYSMVVIAFPLEPACQTK